MPPARPRSALCRRGAAAPVAAPGPLDVVAQAYCRYQRRCCQQSGFDASRLASCEVGARGRMVLLLDERLRDKRVMVDEGKLAACATAGNDVPCGPEVESALGSARG